MEVSGQLQASAGLTPPKKLCTHSIRGWLHSAQSNSCVTVKYVKNCVSHLSTIETVGDKKGYWWNLALYDM